MGTIKKGILGGFNGKVGNVVGSAWKGIAYMRSLPQSVANPQTPAQMAVRQRFSLLSSALSEMNVFISRQVKPLVSTPMSPFNFLMRQNFRNQSVTGTYPNMEIDWAKLDMGKGNGLSVLANANAVVDTGQRTVNLTWDGTISGIDGSLEDEVAVAIFCPAKGESVMVVNGISRASESHSISYPSSWIGESFVVYAGVASPDGAKVSPTAFLGRHEA